MHGIRRITRTSARLVAASFWLTASVVLAQEPAAPRPQPAVPALPLPLPAAADATVSEKAMAAPPATPPSILAIEAHPIDLTTALELANVQNPQFNVARTRIVEAAAMRQLAAAYFLPSINPGLNYDSHTGALQQSDGNILSVNRSAFYIGAGASAVGSGTVQIPGVYFNVNVGAGLFAFLAAKQVVRQREFESIAVRNQMFLRVTEAYSELLRSEGKRAVQSQARDEAKIVARLTRHFGENGLGRAADANRAATQLARREADIQAAEAGVLVASANLCRLLNLDPSIRLHPTDAVVVPQPVVPDPIPVSELIAIAMLHRPELAGQRAAIEAALMTLDGAKVLPFSPTTMLGFSGGLWRRQQPGTTHLRRPLGTDRLRPDHVLDDSEPRRRQHRPDPYGQAQLKVAQFQQVEILNRVRADVAEAYAQCSRPLCSDRCLRRSRPLRLPCLPSRSGPNSRNGCKPAAGCAAHRAPQ